MKTGWYIMKLNSKQKFYAFSLGDIMVQDLSHESLDRAIRPDTKRKDTETYQLFLNRPIYQSLKK